MSSRVTRSRARSETPQTVLPDFFKTTRKPERTRGEKKIIEEDGTQQTISKKTLKAVEVKTKQGTSAKSDGPIASLFEKKASRSRARTPSRQAELSTPEVTGTPPKRSKEVVFPEEEPVIPVENDVILEQPNTEKSSIEMLMEANGDQKKTKTIRSVADLQARLAAKGAAKAIHEQNLKNKAKQVREHAEALKSPKKKVVDIISPVKPKAARSLFSPKKSVPEYVFPRYNAQKSAEKVREEQDDAHEEEGKRIAAEYRKPSKLIEEVQEKVRNRIDLPVSYEKLVDAFKHFDQITAILLNQNRRCIATELFKNTSGRSFNEVHLSQILHVYPEAFQVEFREKPKSFGQGGKYELEVIPNLVDDLRGFIKESAHSEDREELPLVLPCKLLSPIKSPRKPVQAAPRKPELDEKKRLDPARQRDRAHVLRYKLTNIVMEYHSNFLAEQGYPAMPNHKRMHPLFSLKEHCPPVPQKKLPEAPNAHLRCAEHIGMKEALERYSEVATVSLPSSFRKAHADLKSPNKAIMTGAAGNVPISPKKFSEMKKEQESKGGMTLLERIRAREAKQKAAEAGVDKELEKRKMRLDLLKDRFVRIVCNHFTAKLAQTMEMEVVAKFVKFSSQNTSTTADIIDHLRLMCEVAPLYAKEVLLMGKKYLRFVENDMEAINELVTEEIQRVEHVLKEQTNAQYAKLNSPRPSKAARALKFA
ncbi:unnamed protein product [Caenorhabditis sp. 36 PRJEB53466]|nr:unnamed protein product [Caenorhabditis sp. 36 PRJEB53466]